MCSYKSAGNSELFSDFPLNPQNLFRIGGTISGQTLADATEVALIICNEFEIWKKELKDQWPAFADGELLAFNNACYKMKLDTPPNIYHNVNSSKIRTLFKQYISLLKNNNEAFTNFMNAKWTLFNTMIDFGNTIACGGTLQTSLQWYA